MARLPVFSRGASQVFFFQLSLYLFLPPNLSCWTHGSILLRCFFPYLPQRSRGLSSFGTSFQSLFWLSVVDHSYYMLSPLRSFNKYLSFQSFSLYSLCSATFYRILQTPLSCTGQNILRMIFF